MIKLLEQIKKGESQTTEFKLSFQKEVIASVVAFANAQGGKVFIGVNDDGKIVGVDIQQESLQNWINQIKLSTVPSVIPDIYIETISGCSLVIIDVKDIKLCEFEYSLLGDIVGKTKKAKRTIEIFNLNYKSLVEQRARISKQIESCRAYLNYDLFEFFGEFKSFLVFLGKVENRITNEA